MSSYANRLFISILVQLILSLILVTNHVIHSWTQIIILWIICGSSFITALYLINGRARPVYLIGFSCYKPRESLKFTREAFVGRAIEVGTFTDENIQFQKRMLERSGLGQATYFPEGVAKLPPDLSILEARSEGEEVMFGAVDELIKNTGIKLHNIGILIVNCSLFSPTPSLSDMIMNRYKLREDIVTYNLSGMGCSAGIISVDLARHFLKVHSNSYALIVSTENITQNGYYGNQRSMLVTNCLFRMGGAAVLLSNHPSERTHAKYVLTDLIRTHKGAHDESFTCVTQEEDDKGKVGVSLSKDLMAVAGEALKANITTLGPRVLPLSEQLRFLVTFIRRKVLNAKVAPYVPNFKLAFEHFCIHAGGRAILDELEKRLQLTEWHMEPSRMALCRFGNTSSSSLWYELAYSEAKKRVKKGDRVWQIGFGSGFKCNSMVWKALKDVQPIERYPWMDVIDEFPVHVPRVAKIDM